MEKRSLRGEIQCIRKSRIGLAALNWRRRLDRKGQWDAINLNTGIGRWLMGSHKAHRSIDYKEKMPEGEWINSEDEDSMSMLSGS